MSQPEAFDRFVLALRTDPAAEENGATQLRDGLSMLAGCEQVCRYTLLVNDLLGHRLDDWSAAAQLNEQAVGRGPREVGLAPALFETALSLYMMGAAPRAMAMELRAMALLPSGVDDLLMRARLELVDELLGSDRWAEGVPLLEAVFELSDGRGKRTPAGREVATMLESIALTLLSQRRRAPELSDLMCRSARLASSLWSSFAEPLRLVRTSYTLARVEAAAGNHEQAVEAAKVGLRATSRLREPMRDTEAAFLHVELARALRELGRDSEHQRVAAEAVRIGERIGLSLGDWVSARLG